MKAGCHNSHIAAPVISSAERAATLVEAAVALPILLMLITGALEFARVLTAYLLVQFALQQSIDLAVLEQSMTQRISMPASATSGCPSGGPANPEMQKFYEARMRIAAVARGLASIMVSADDESGSLYLKRFYSLYPTGADSQFRSSSPPSNCNPWLTLDGIVLLRPGESARKYETPARSPNHIQNLLAPTGGSQAMSDLVARMPILAFAELRVRPLLISFFNSGELIIPISVYGFYEKSAGSSSVFAPALPAAAIPTPDVGPTPNPSAQQVCTTVHNQNCSSPSSCSTPPCCPIPGQCNQCRTCVIEGGD